VRRQSGAGPSPRRGAGAAGLLGLGLLACASTIPELQHRAILDQEALRYRERVAELDARLELATVTASVARRAERAALDRRAERNARLEATRLALEVRAAGGRGPGSDEVESVWAAVGAVGRGPDGALVVRLAADALFLPDELGAGPPRLASEAIDAQAIAAVATAELRLRLEIDDPDPIRAEARARAWAAALIDAGVDPSQLVALSRSASAPSARLRLVDPASPASQPPKNVRVR
jgi:hypothetical protein